MESILFNNKEVEVTSVFFSNNRNQLRFESYPRRLVYKGREYILADS
jgi:predicted transcriptional regulator